MEQLEGLLGLCRGEDVQGALGQLRGTCVPDLVHRVSALVERHLDEMRQGEAGAKARAG